jgi:surfactin synthase thioesterase subunit
VCFPPAGGDVEMFGGWSERLPSVDVGLVQLAGHPGRLSEPLTRSIREAADGVAGAVARTPASPTVLFGHGLGALIAFETARRLRDRSWPLLALFVSGCPAPALLRPETSFDDLPTEEFVSEVRARYDVIPDAVLGDADLMQLFLPGLRADVAMAAGYEYAPDAPLPCPIVVCGGSADPRAPRPQLEAWRGETRVRASVHLFAGGPQYVRQEQAAVTALIANQLTVLLGAMSRCSGRA